MPRKTLIAALTAVLFGCTGALPARAEAPSAPTPQRVQPVEIDSFVRDQQLRNGVPGLAVVVTLGDEVIYAEGHGIDGAGSPISAATPFRIGSLSKAVTAAAVLQLVEAGQIDLDAPVREYLPDFTTADPAHAARITVRDLLNQTSGLSEAGFPENRLPYPATLQGRLESLQAARPVSDPGAAFAYFNPNYDLLALIVERVSAQPYEEYVQRNLFEPLGMQSSVTRASLLAQPPEGFLAPFSVAVPAREINDWLPGSGGMVSTPEDLAAFLIMQANGGAYAGQQIISPESIDLMHSTPAQVDSPYGMGWWVEQREDGLLLQHGGDIRTFHADMLLLPEEGIGIAVLYNTNHFLNNFVTYPQITEGLIALARGQSPQTSFGFRTVGLLFAAVALLSTLQTAFSLRSADSWLERARARGSAALWGGMIGPFVPALFLVLLPVLASRALGRDATFGNIFSYMPDMLGWLVLGVLLGIAQGITRISAVQRAGGPSQAAQGT